MREFLRKIDWGGAVIGIVLILVIIAAMSILGAVVQGGISRFPGIFIKTIGFILVAPLILAFILPLMFVMLSVDLLIFKAELVLGGSRRVRFLVRSGAFVMCFLTAYIGAEIISSFGGELAKFLAGYFAISFAFTGLQIFAVAFNSTAASSVEGVVVKFRKSK